jgi:hypothetical protein
MATNFPGSLDSFTNPSASDAMDSVTVPHADQHANLNDAVEALESKVGVDGSAVTSSLDYKVNALPRGVIAKAQRTTSFTLNTTSTTLLSVTFNADSSRLYLIMGHGLPDNINAVGFEELGIFIDGTLRQANPIAYLSTSLDLGTSNPWLYYSYPSSGSSTVELKGKVGGGATSGRIYADSSVPTQLIVLDVGGS